MSTIPKFTQIAASNVDGGLVLYALGEDGVVYAWQNDDSGCGWSALPSEAYPDEEDEPVES